MSHRPSLLHRKHTEDARSGLGVAIRRPSMDMNPSKPGKCDDKEVMHGLNDRLAGFIEKVHQLELHNHLLEREIQEIRGKSKPSVEEEYSPELRRLRQLVLDISHQKHQLEVEHHDLEEEVSSLKRECEKEAQGRTDAERSIMILKRDISDAYQAKLQLDKKAKALVEEMQLLKRDHEAEVSEMFDRIQESAEECVKAHRFGHPGVTAALRDIRTQLEGQTQPDVQQLGETFRSQFAKLTEAAEIKREALKASQQEVQEHRRRLLAKDAELDGAKGTREALERQLHEVEDRHKEEIIHYQNTIKELENELINCKFDMSGYLREYQDLLNVKMALDVEILSYRKLLCGEEARLSSMSESHMSLPYIYHQSPIYTLPLHSRPGATRRRAEPHYKFVEEIITETTREIEMSEFEETGSEGTDGGKDEQGSTKRERGSSEEEEEDKDSGEDEGEQVSDGQQNQVASDEDLVNGCDKSGESPAERDDVDEIVKSTSKEPEKVDSEEDSGRDKNTQNEAEKTVDQTTDEQPKIDGNKEDVAERNSSLKTVVLEAEVPVEGELLDQSKKDKQGNDGQESCTSNEESRGVDETSGQVSKESDKTKEGSSGDKVEEKVGKVEEKMGDVSEKAQKMSTTTSENGEIMENSPPDELDTAKSKGAVAKNNQENENSSNKNKDSSPESTN